MQTPSQRKKSLVAPLAQYLAMCVVLLTTRLLFHGRTLYEWDAAGYALALERFDILWHRPHPPGYIFYVGLAKLIHLAIQDANLTLITLNLLLSLITLGLTCWLAYRMAGQRVMILTGWLMTFTPMFWFYGSVSAIYVADALCAVVIGWWCWASFSGRERHLILAAFFLGFMGGFRQTITVLMLPLFLYAMVVRRRSWGQYLSYGIALGVGMGCWYIPTILSTGGLQNFMASYSALQSGGADKLEIFFKGPLLYYTVNFSNVAVWGLQMVGGGVFLMPWLAIRTVQKSGWRGLLTNRAACFSLAWFVPSFVFYVFLFIDKPGYLLVIFPISAIVTATAILRLMERQRLTAWLVYAGMLAAFVLWFVVPAQANGRYYRIYFPENILPRPPQSDYAWDLSTREIAFVDARMEALIPMLADPAYGRGQTVLVARGGMPNYRQLGYYFPDLPVYWLIDANASGRRDFNAEYYRTYRHEDSSGTGLPYWMPAPRPPYMTVELSAGTRKILWFMPTYSQFYQDLAAMGRIDATLTIPTTGETIALSTIDPDRPIEVSLFTIQTR